MASFDTPIQRLSRAAERAVEAIADSLAATNFKLSIQEREVLEDRVQRILQEINAAEEGLDGDRRAFVSRRITEELQSVLDERLDELADY
jgi:hypothetical protein